MQQLDVVPIVSLPTEEFWSQVIKHSSGTSTTVLAMTIRGVAAQSVAKRCAADLKSQQIQRAEELYELVSTCNKRAVARRCTVEIAAATVVGTELFVATQLGSVLLKRDETVGTLLRGTATEPNVVIGSAKPRDVVVIATASSRTFLGELRQKLLQGYDVDTATTSLISGVRAAEQQCAIGVIQAEPKSDPPKSDQPKSRLKRDSEVEVAQEVINSNDHEETAAVMTAVESAVAEDQKQLNRRSPLSWFQDKTTTGLKVLWTMLTPFRTPRYMVREQQRKRLIWLVGVMALLVCLAAAGIWWLYSQRQLEEAAVATTAPYRERLATAEQLYTEDPLAARQSVATIIQELQTAVAAEDNSAVLGRLLSAELETAQQIFENISGRDELAELPIFYDLRLADSDFVASFAAGSGETAIFVDAGQQQAAVLSVSSKQVVTIPLRESESTTGDPLSNPRSVVWNETTNVGYLLANGIFSLEQIENNWEVSQVIAEGDSNRAGAEIGAYQSFLYVVNPEERNIFRYLLEEEGFSDPVGWLQSALGTTLSEVTSVAVDGDIWLATADGEIRRFRTGAETPFDIVGLPEDFSSALKLVAPEESELLYILEPAQSRVVILTKEGEFRREIQNSSLGSATDILVSEANNSALVVSGSLVFEIEL